jgi:hypothetical protein
MRYDLLSFRLLDGSSFIANAKYTTEGGGGGKIGCEG